MPKAVVDALKHERACCDLVQESCKISSLWFYCLYIGPLQNTESSDSPLHLTAISHTSEAVFAFGFA